MVLRSVLCALLWLWVSISCRSIALGLEDSQTATLSVIASPGQGRPIPEHMFGISFEEINHAGAGGIWAELVCNRGFEDGGTNTPSNIYPWSIIGNESYIMVSTDRTSCFNRNKVALRMEILCDDDGPNICPSGGVGIHNPGYWGMNIERGEIYKIALHVKSNDSIDLYISLTSSDGLQNLATTDIKSNTLDMSQWTKVELLVRASGTNVNSRLQLKTNKKGVIWLDQVSVMPLETYKGHGFRKDLASMLADLKPQFLRFPGGSYAEGGWLNNAFRWRDTIGPWEERPGHFNDIWKYWVDDGLGFYEFLQLAEDIGADPLWVINAGISHNDQVNPANILPFVQDTLDGIEFARGDSGSKWGCIRAAMGHSDPFLLNYIAIGNQDCSMRNYRGNYFRFHSAIKKAYPDIKVISNCDGSSGYLDHPADMYDVHVYASADSMFSMSHYFDWTPRVGPKALVSEYAVTGSGAGKGSFLAALAQAGFLIGLERNSDVVEMASNAPLFVNDNDRRWNPDAIVFDSWRHYGTPSYWMQHFFKESSGAIFQPSNLQSTSSKLVASAIRWTNSDNGNDYLKIKIVNYGGDLVNLKISVTGLANHVRALGSTNTILTGKLTDENSFSNPEKVVPIVYMLPNAGKQMNVSVSPYSINALDLLLAPESSTAVTDI
ncbi:alpha-L-arabinofuranosidase 1-like [Zingiber officinale]|uniref:alpha-L-arabinofuranosidase 1-like n=1 Tax=Zingiber officinale TaxID=94328 RepID=UPI001C4CEA31|nr:alpha-L-arabinofuranosidase 1-like [Zingiber officinale]